MAKHTTLPDIVITKTVDKPSADFLPTQLPATPEAPPVPPTEVTFPDEAFVVLTDVPGHLPDWLLGGG